eukprot:1149016-Pelagomonas_calceolata.AAC.1
MYVIRITDTTDWRSNIGPNSLFNSKSESPQPESGSVAKDMMDATGFTKMIRTRGCYYEFLREV